jgi:MGT family glycosyltransferase
VLRELQVRGHEVALRTLAGEVEAMRSLGFEANPIAPEIEALPMDDWKARGRVAGQARGLRVFAARAPHEVSDLRRAIEQERPDALLVDALTLGGLSVAEAWGGPWAAFAPLFLPVFAAGGTPAGPGLGPLPEPLGGVRDWAVRAFLRAGLRRLSSPSLNPVRASVGLSPLGDPQELYLAPPLLIYMTAEPFEPARPNRPKGFAMVGPCEWEPPGGLPTELAGVEAPLVLVTTSSEFQDDGALVSTALDALAGEPFHVVATMPAAGAARLSVPANATVLPFAPHGPILERAACAITHGGMGATQKALARGVPVCAVPVGRDQFEVARRVEVSGAGSRLPAGRLRPVRLREKVYEAVACRGGAERIAAAFASAGGAGAAADAFEQRLLDA